MVEILAVMKECCTIPRSSFCTRKQYDYLNKCKKPDWVMRFETRMNLAKASVIAVILGMIAGCNSPRGEGIPTVYSHHVRDSFELYIDLPKMYSADSNYSIVFYMDANLKLGQEIRRQIRLDANKQNLTDVIFVGVGHIGDYREKRRRDFIPPVVDDSDVREDDDQHFGHADLFYKFLTHELIPHIDKTYPTNNRYTVIGHSLSGLFAFYCMLQPEGKFTNHAALSPSLWINDDHMFEVEDKFHKEHRELRTTLYHSCGTWEWMNKVLDGSRRMNAVLENRYKGLNYVYVEHEGKTHNGVVPVSLEYVLSKMEF